MFQSVLNPTSKCLILCWIPKAFTTPWQTPLVGHPGCLQIKYILNKINYFSLYLKLVFLLASISDWLIATWCFWSFSFLAINSTSLSHKICHVNLVYKVLYHMVSGDLFSSLFVLLTSFHFSPLSYLLSNHNSQFSGILMHFHPNVLSRWPHLKSHFFSLWYSLSLTSIQDNVVEILLLRWNESRA